MSFYVLYNLYMIMITRIIGKFEQERLNRLTLDRNSAFFLFSYLLERRGQIQFVAIFILTTKLHHICHATPKNTDTIFHYEKSSLFRTNYVYLVSL